MLVYLNADDMRDQGTHFAEPAEWEHLVRVHSALLFPDAVWERRWEVGRRSFH